MDYLLARHQEGSEEVWLHSEGTFQMIKNKRMTEVVSGIWGEGVDYHGQAPSIILINPKYAQNVGMVVRLASCYDMKQVWWTGNRVHHDLSGKKRLPREERLRGYQEVQMIHYDRPFDQFSPEAVPVAIEVRENSEMLTDFEHPEHAVYVFGPEDGSINSTLLRHCHRFVVIPTRHCLNLATAVSTVLWDRKQKRHALGLDTLEHPGEHERRGFEEIPSLVSMR